MVGCLIVKSILKTNPLPIEVKEKVIFILNSPTKLFLTPLNLGLILPTKV